MTDGGQTNEHGMRLPDLVVAAAVAAYVLLMGLTCHVKYLNYGYCDFDLAVHAQSVWNILHGSLQSSILGIPCLGNHMALVLFLIAPIYALFGTPLVLLHVQTLALALAGLGVYKLATMKLPKSWAAAFAVLFLIYPPLLYLNLFEFHPIALAVPALVWMIFFHRQSRFAPFVATLLLALSCQENVSLIIVAFAFMALIEGRRGRWFWTPLLAGLAHFAAAMLIMPRLNGGVIQFERLYGPLGGSLTEVAANAILHPGRAIGIAATGEKLVFLNALFAPLGFLSLLSPLNLVPALPAFAQRLLSVRLSECSIAYHYQAEFIPFIFAAAIAGTSKALAMRARLARPLVTGLLVALPLAALAATDVVARMCGTVLPLRAARNATTEMDRLTQQIPRNAAVMATFRFQPRLANRSAIFSFHHVYTGTHTLSDVPYPMPDVAFALFDTNDELTFGNLGFHAPDNYKRIAFLLDDPRWQLVEQADSLLMFRRLEAAAKRKAPLIEFPAEEPPMCTSVKQIPNAPATLAGFNIGPQDERDFAPCTLYWRKADGQDADWDAVLFIADDKNESLYTGRLAPGSRLRPPQSWPADQLVADHHRIRLSRRIATTNDITSSVVLLPKQ